MNHKYLYPRQRQIEVLGALYAGGLGVYTGISTVSGGVAPLAWIGGNQIGIAEVLVTASMIWALGIRINGAWRFSPFLRLAGMLAHFSMAVSAVIAGAGTSASYTYGWVAALLFIGARNAARDCFTAWGAKWQTQT